LVDRGRVLRPVDAQDIYANPRAEFARLERSGALHKLAPSHLLAAISMLAGESVIFFGGTALGRSVVPDGRLSEDVDLIAVDRRNIRRRRMA
jgi:predicted nucleotidyltransferase component of viral defense system